MENTTNKSTIDITYKYNDKIETIHLELENSDDEIISAAENADSEAAFKFAVKKIKELHFKDEITPIETVRDLSGKLGITEIRGHIQSKNIDYKFS